MRLAFLHLAGRTKTAPEVKGGGGCLAAEGRRRVRREESGRLGLPPFPHRLSQAVAGAFPLSWGKRSAYAQEHRRLRCCLAVLFIGLQPSASGGGGDGDLNKYSIPSLHATCTRQYSTTCTNTVKQTRREFSFSFFCTGSGA